MKILIASDIHGSILHMKRLEKAFLKHKVDQIILLGDLLYIGPRNKMHLFYRPEKVMHLLNKWASKIKAVLGNCDSEIDQAVLHFSLPKRQTIKVNNYRLHLMHGHDFDLQPFKIIDGDLVFFGHTHQVHLEKKDNYFLFNPGSITYPKGKEPHTYMLLCNDKIELYNLNNKLLESFDLK